jgi:hypothetical protein
MMDVAVCLRVSAAVDRPREFYYYYQHSKSPETMSHGPRREDISIGVEGRREDEDFYVEDVEEEEDQAELVYVEEDQGSSKRKRLQVRHAWALFKVLY